MTTRVKVCGLTRVEDVLLAGELGAWAAGFVRTESPRRVDTEAAASLIRAARRSATLAPVAVLVFACEEASLMAQEAIRTGADAVQLSAGVAGPTVAALRDALVRSGATETIVVAAADTPDAVDADLILRDARVPGLWGGSGRTLDWALVAGQPELRRDRLILAGGLTRANVGRAIRTLRPFAVDASSGLERKPGVKDAAAMRAFFRAVAAADATRAADTPHAPVEDSRRDR